MGSVKTSLQMVESVKRRAMLPDGESTFDTDDFLDVLNEELMIGLISTILKVHEEFYVHTHLAPIVSGTYSYTIPSRAIGLKCRNVQLSDAAGNLAPMTRIKPEDAADYRYDSNAFYFKNDKIVLLGSTTSGSLQMDIFLRPNQLVNTNRGATISAIDTTTGIITFGSDVPSHFAMDLDYDFVANNGPCKILGFDKTASAQTSRTLTFDPDDLSDELKVGDYVTIAEETIVPQMPVEIVPILEQRAAVYCLEAIGDFEGLQLAQKKLERMETNINTLIDNRSEGNPQKIVSRNSLLSRVVNGNTFSRGR